MLKIYSSVSSDALKVEFNFKYSYFNMFLASGFEKCDCWDNAIAESFFKTLKVEHIYHHRYKTTKEAEPSVFEHIETWLNVNRIHTTINTSKE